jgi:hypothetical protein
MSLKWHLKRTICDVRHSVIIGAEADMALTLGGWRGVTLSARAEEVIE